MTHFKRITKPVPAGANTFEDVACIVINALNALLESFGTSSPLGDFLGTKCTFPTPNE